MSFRTWSEIFLKTRLIIRKILNQVQDDNNEVFFYVSVVRKQEK